MVTFKKETATRYSQLLNKALVLYGLVQWVIGRMSSLKKEWNGMKWKEREITLKPIQYSRNEWTIDQTWVLGPGPSIANGKFGT